ncbi:MAG: hypothetical protein AB7P04_08005 [Bacteriovoracia bacterium]
MRGIFVIVMGMVLATALGGVRAEAALASAGGGGKVPVNPAPNPFLEPLRRIFPKDVPSDIEDWKDKIRREIERIDCTLSPMPETCEAWKKEALENLKSLREFGSCITDYCYLFNRMIRLLKLFEKYWKEIDTDGDGKVSAEELAAFLLKKYDRNGDGVIDVSDFDTNGDGVISPEEAEAYRRWMNRDDFTREFERLLKKILELLKGLGLKPSDLLLS